MYFPTTVFHFLCILFAIRLSLVVLKVCLKRSKNIIKNSGGLNAVGTCSGSLFLTGQEKDKRTSAVDPFVIGDRSQTVKFLVDYPNFLHASDVETLIRPFIYDIRAWMDNNLIEILPRLDLSQLLYSKRDFETILGVFQIFSQKYSKSPVINVLTQLQMELIVEVRGDDKYTFRKLVESRKNFFRMYSHSPFMEKIVSLMKIPLSSNLEAKLRSENIDDLLDISTTHDYMDVMAAYDVLIESTKVNHFGEYVMLKQLVLLCLTARVNVSSNRWFQNRWLNSVLEIYSSLSPNFQYFLILMTLNIKEFNIAHSLLANTKSEDVINVFKMVSGQKIDVINVLEPSPRLFFLYLNSLVDASKWEKMTEKLRYFQISVPFPIKSPSNLIYTQLGVNIGLDIVSVISNRKYHDVRMREITVDQSLVAFIFNPLHPGKNSWMSLNKFFRNPNYDIAVSVQGSARQFLKETFGEVFFHPDYAKTIVNFFSSDMVKFRKSEEKLCEEKHQQKVDNADDIPFPTDSCIESLVKEPYIYVKDSIVYGIGLEMDNIESVAKAIVQLTRYGFLPESLKYKVAKEFLEPFRSKFTDIDMDEVLISVFPFMKKLRDNPAKSKNVLFSKLPYIKGDEMKKNVKHLMKIYFYRLKYLVHAIELKYVHSVERVKKAVSKKSLDFSLESIKKEIQGKSTSQSLFYLLSEQSPFLKCLDAESLLLVGKDLFRSENINQLLFNYVCSIKDELLPEAGALQNIKVMRLEFYQEMFSEKNEFDGCVEMAMASICLCRSGLCLDEEEHNFVRKQFIFCTISSSLHEQVASAYYSYAIKHFRSPILIDLFCKNESMYEALYVESLFLESWRTKELVEVAVKTAAISPKLLLILTVNSAFWKLADRSVPVVEKYFRDGRIRGQLNDLLKASLSVYQERLLNAMNIICECVIDSTIVANNSQGEVAVETDSEEHKDREPLSSEKASEDAEEALLPDAKEQPQEKTFPVQNEEQPLVEPFQSQDQKGCEVSFSQTEIKPIESLFEFTEEGLAIPKTDISVEDISRIFKAIHYRSEGFPFLLHPLFYSWSSNFNIDNDELLDYGPWQPSESWEEIKLTYFCKGLNRSKLWDCRVHPIKLEASCPKICAAAISSLDGKLLARLQSLVFYSQKAGQRKQDMLVQYQFSENTNQVRIENGILFIDKSLKDIQSINKAISQKLCDESIDKIVKIRKVSKKPNEEVNSDNQLEQKPQLGEKSPSESIEKKEKILSLIDVEQKPLLGKSGYKKPLAKLKLEKSKKEAKALSLIENKKANSEDTSSKTSDNDPIRPNAIRKKERPSPSNSKETLPALEEAPIPKERKLEANLSNSDDLMSNYLSLSTHNSFDNAKEVSLSKDTIISIDSNSSRITYNPYSPSPSPLPFPSYPPQPQVHPTFQQSPGLHYTGNQFVPLSRIIWHPLNSVTPNNFNSVIIKITRDNFFSTIGLLQNAILESSACSFDMEMSGLFPPEGGFANNFEKIATGVNMYQVVQFGLTCWRTTIYGPQISVWSVMLREHGFDKVLLYDPKALQMITDHGFDQKVHEKEFCESFSFMHAIIPMLCSKPIIVHNGLADLLHLFKLGGHFSFPDESTFENHLHSFFDMFWDTKSLAVYGGGVPVKDSDLVSLARSKCGIYFDDRQAHEAAFDAFLTMRLWLSFKDIQTALPFKNVLFKNQ